MGIRRRAREEAEASDRDQSRQWNWAIAAYGFAPKKEEEKEMSVATHENRQAVSDLAKEIGARTIIEIGVRRGRLSVLLAEVPTLKHLFLVDTWEPEGATHQDQKKNARSVKRWAKRRPDVTVLHMDSAKAVHQFSDNSIDFVYVDGDHSFEGASLDIKNYLPKVSKGGIICGDDYYLRTVRDAVAAYIDNPHVHANGRYWWAYK
jgi:predicted O-methyltransferase YrrM